MKKIRIAAVVVLGIGLAGLGVETSGAEPVALLVSRPLADGAGQLESLPRSGRVHLALTCCKVCSKGKACGNSCIARDKTCRKGPGCACDRR